MCVSQLVVVLGPEEILCVGYCGVFLVQLIWFNVCCHGFFYAKIEQCESCINFMGDLGNVHFYLNILLIN